MPEITFIFYMHTPKKSEFQLMLDHEWQEKPLLSQRARDTQMYSNNERALRPSQTSLGIVRTQCIIFTNSNNMRVCVGELGIVISY